MMENGQLALRILTLLNNVAISIYSYKIRFEFSGLSLQAILDRLPTAKVVEKNSNASIIEAEVNNGRGIIMYLLSQGSWVKILSPACLIDDMREEIEKMRNLYR